MYSNSLPKTGEIRYWCFVNNDNEPRLLKFSTLDNWYDEDDETAVASTKVIESYIGTYRTGDRIELDTPWQLQKTLENAKRVMIIGVFKSDNAFFCDDPPWSLNV